jgi:CcmD family protein
MSLLDPGIAIYVALAVALATWLLLFAYIWRLDAQAQELKRRLDAAERRPPGQAQRSTPTATLQTQRNGIDTTAPVREQKE